MAIIRSTVRRNRETGPGTPAQQERRKLVEAPFPPIDRNRRIPSYLWAGALIPHFEIPTEGRRAYVRSPEDEEVGTVAVGQDFLEDGAA